MAVPTCFFRYLRTGLLSLAIHAVAWRSKLLSVFGDPPDHFGLIAKDTFLARRKIELQAIVGDRGKCLKRIRATNRIGLVLGRIEKERKKLG